MTAGALPFVGKSIVAGATTVGVGAFAVGTALGTSVAAAGLAVYDQVVNPNGVIYGTNGEILDYTKSAKAGIWLQNTGNSIKTFATGIVNGVTDRFEMTGGGRRAAALSIAKKGCAAVGGAGIPVGVAEIPKMLKEDENSKEGAARDMALLGSGAVLGVTSLAIAKNCLKEDTRTPAGVGFGLGILYYQNKRIQELEKGKSGQTQPPAPTATPTTTAPTATPTQTPATTQTPTVPVVTSSPPAETPPPKEVQPEESNPPQ